MSYVTHELVFVCKIKEKVIYFVSKGEKGQESRARLLAAATYEFAHHGYHETKVSMIVARADLTQAAFYLYFPSKEAIFQALITDFREHISHLALAIRLQPGLSIGDIPEKIRQGVEQAFLFCASYPDLTRIGLFIAPQAEQLKVEFVKIVTENLLVEQQEGYIRSDLDVYLVAESLLGMIERLIMHWLLPGRKDASLLARQMTDFVVHGILVNSKFP